MGHRPPPAVRCQSVNCEAPTSRKPAARHAMRTLVGSSSRPMNASSRRRRASSALKSTRSGARSLGRGRCAPSSPSSPAPTKPFTGFSTTCSSSSAAMSRSARKPAVCGRVSPSVAVACTRVSATNPASVSTTAAFLVASLRPGRCTGEGVVALALVQHAAGRDAVLLRPHRRVVLAERRDHVHVRVHVLPGRPSQPLAVKRHAPYQRPTQHPPTPGHSRSGAPGGRTSLTSSKVTSPSVSGLK